MAGKLSGNGRTKKAVSGERMTLVTLSIIVVRGSFYLWDEDSGEITGPWSVLSLREYLSDKLGQAKKKSSRKYLRSWRRNAVNVNIRPATPSEVANARNGRRLNGLRCPRCDRLSLRENVDAT